MAHPTRGTWLLRCTNLAETALLLAAETALVLYAGERLGGTAGLAWAAAGAVALNAAAWWRGDRLALAMHRARPADRAAHPALFEAVAELSARAGLPAPGLYVIPSKVPNAFAAGRDPAHAVVAVTEGLLALLDGRQLRAVLAHELGHVQHRDTLIATVAAALAGTLSLLARAAFLFRGGRRGGPGALLVAPLVALLLQLALSRSREYDADAAGAELCGDPGALAEALERLEASVREAGEAPQAATSHLFTVSPYAGQALAAILSTHPATADRVARLRGR